MTLPPLTDQKVPWVDPIEALRVLVAELRALVARLELKDGAPGLQDKLNAAQERVSGPRAVVVLLGEHEALKRRFLERLLGPNLAHLPNPTTVCTRLEYGAEPESTVVMPEQMPAATPLDPLENFLGRRITNDSTSSIPISTPIGTPIGTPGEAPIVSPIGSPTGEAPEETQEEPEKPEKLHPMQLIRLPNPTLQGGLAVIDTPAVESGEPDANVLQCAEQADAWIFVLNADHALSEGSQTLLRRLPERGARLEIVVENADSLSGEERLAARDRLMRTLRERCDIESPRLTLVASAATEGDEGNFWHGRFATFHSVMMLRGREHWMAGTRALVQDALSQVGAEIDIELKSVAMGVRHARLRLGMKDLDGLRTRFSGLGLLEGERPGETKTADPQPAAAIPQQSRLDWSAGMDGQATKAEPVDGLSPLTILAEAIASMAPEPAGTETAPPKEDAEAAMLATVRDAVMGAAKQPEIAIPHAESLSSGEPAADIGTAKPAVTPAQSAAALPARPAPAEPALVGSRESAAKVRPKRGVSVHLSGGLRQLVPRSSTAQSGTVRLLKRIAWVALVIAFICLILWALAPRGFLFGQEQPAEWDFQQPKPALASRAVPAAPDDADAGAPQPGSASSLPDTAGAATPNIPTAALTKHKGAVRIPLVHPIPTDATAGVPQYSKRHHRHLLGLGKLWHWVRHPRHGKSGQDIQ
jgi:hypothetical protein